jgi:NADPH:quinone reductase-like Zn-dependent oxidoreductase
VKAIVVTDQAAGTAGMTLVERPEPQAAINDVVVQVHASGFVPTELAWPSTWTDRLDRDRTPSIPGHELAGVVEALGYGTRGLSVGQRVFGLTDWYRDGTLAEYVAVEARNLAPLPGDVDFTVGASLLTHCVYNAQMAWVEARPSLSKGRDGVRERIFCP